MDITRITNRPLSASIEKLRSSRCAGAVSCAKSNNRFLGLRVLHGSTLRQGYCNRVALKARSAGRETRMHLRCAIECTKYRGSGAAEVGAFWC
ncbi:hypothetical protein EVAR_21651_1 [Eumeta japonica]|uniref:Uncharacterized protein n=1 Tax=Eumeta variegata TaxID=151549 RepID=A0A4C1VFA9_EUMVA|nr:hypothetical protein EVAR_21651_1 [Eumeta japonica]